MQSVQCHARVSRLAPVAANPSPIMTIPCPMCRFPMPPNHPLDVVSADPDIPATIPMPTPWLPDHGFSRRRRDEFHSCGRRRRIRIWRRGDYASGKHEGCNDR